MKKKKIIIIAVVVILMLVPIPMKLKDGGSAEYKAVLYKITKVHRLNEQSSTGYENGWEIIILGFQVYNEVNVEAKTNNDDDCCDGCVCGDTINLIKNTQTAWTLTKIDNDGNYEYFKESFINLHGTGKNKFAFFSNDKEIKGDFVINDKNKVILIPNNKEYNKITCTLGEEKELIAVLNCDNNFGTFTIQKQGTIELPNNIKETLEKVKSIKFKYFDESNQIIKIINNENDKNELLSIMKNSKVWTGPITSPSVWYELQLFDINNKIVATIEYTPNHYFLINIDDKNYDLILNRELIDKILERNK